LATTRSRTRGARGVAPQDVHLDRLVSARDLLIYHARYFGLDRLEARRRADELLEGFDLTSKAHSRPNRLSGGMRRRLLIARALVHRPQLAMLDEPTAGVDLELRQEQWAHLRHLRREEQLTVLPTTHYLEEAQALCDRVAFIRDGSILAEGTTERLVQRYAGGSLEDAYVQAMRRSARSRRPSCGRSAAARPGRSPSARCAACSRCGRRRCCRRSSGG
jgi:ABC-2 type transport system ATP-binding protein